MDLIKTSSFVSILKSIWNRCISLAKWITAVWRDSCIYGFIQKACLGIKACFRNSFLARRASEACRYGHAEFIDNSRAIKWISGLLGIWKNKMRVWIYNSRTTGFAKDIKNELIISPVMAISIILVTSIGFNLLLSCLFKYRISICGLTVRLLFFLLGCAGLFCKSGWLDIKGSSLFLRLITKDNNVRDLREDKF